MLATRCGWCGTHNRASQRFSPFPATLGKFSEARDDVVEDGGQDAQRVLRRVDDVDDLGAVEIEDGPGFTLVGLQALADDFEVGVVEAVVAEGAALEAFGQLADVSAGEAEDGADIERVAQNLGLARVPRNAVEHERVALGMKAAELGLPVHVLLPEFDGGFVGHEVAAAGILEEFAGDRAVDAQIAEEVAARQVIEAGNGAENFSLRALAGTGRSEEQPAALRSTPTP